MGRAASTEKVAVREAREVHRAQTIREGDQDAFDLVEGEPRRAGPRLGQQVDQGGAAQPLHDQAVHAPMGADAEDRHDARVTDRDDRVGFFTRRLRRLSLVPHLKMATRRPRIRSTAS